MIEIGGNQRARNLVNMMDGIEHPNRAPITFIELSKTHEAAHCPDETRRLSDSLFLDVFVQLLSNWEQYFSEFIVSLFGKSSQYRIPFQSHTEHDLLWMKTGFWGG